MPSREANSVHVMKMCQAFTQEGFEASLVVQWRYFAGLSGAATIWDYYGVQDPFPLFRIPRIRGVRLLHHRWLSALYARLKNFDLAYARDLTAASLVARMGTPTIFEAHQPIPDREHDTREFRSLLQSSNLLHLVVITHALKRHYLENYSEFLDEDRIVVAPDGVDLERFSTPRTPQEARAELGRPSERFTVGYVGHLYPGRGIEIILQLARELPNVDFLIIGGNEKDISFHKHNTSNPMTENVKFMGFVPNGDLAKYLFACDVLLMPYQRRLTLKGGRGDTAKWTSPMKMFEYMAAERLILSSDLPVLREILNDENAMLLPPEDTGAWRDAIKKAMNDDEWRTRLANRARKDVNKYSWRNRVNVVLSEHCSSC